MSVYTDEQKKSFEEHGYFITKDAVEPDMVSELRDAGHRV